MDPAIRSLLFVPGDREDLVLKAIASAADAVIIDLEDAVAPENKARARGAVREVLGGRSPFDETTLGADEHEAPASGTSITEGIASIQDSDEASRMRAEIAAKR